MQSFMLILDILHASLIRNEDRHIYDVHITLRDLIYGPIIFLKSREIHATCLSMCFKVL